MKKITPKTIVIVSLCLLILLGIFLKVVTPSTTSPSSVSSLQPTLEPSSSIEFSSLSAGKTTLDKVIEQFGQPISSTKSSETTTIYQFASTNPYLPYKVTINEQSRQTELIDRPLVEKPQENLIEKYTKEFNATPIKLYSQTSLSGIYLYVFLKQGFALEATENKGLGLSIKYFPPTDINTFIEKYAPEYSLSFDPNKFHD